MPGVLAPGTGAGTLRVRGPRGAARGGAAGGGASVASHELALFLVLAVGRCLRGERPLADPTHSIGWFHMRIIGSGRYPMPLGDAVSHVTRAG